MTGRSRRCGSGPTIRPLARSRSLARAPPPGVPPAEWRRRPLAVKTGTSYGFRDFWAIGYDAQVTIAVWAGRPDGTPMPGHSGRTTAAPVLFKIADLLGPAPAKASSPA